MQRHAQAGSLSQHNDYHIHQGARTRNRVFKAIWANHWTVWRACKHPECSNQHITLILSGYSALRTTRASSQNVGKLIVNWSLSCPQRNFIVFYCNWRMISLKLQIMFAVPMGWLDFQTHRKLNSLQMWPSTTYRMTVLVAREYHILLIANCKFFLRQ